LLNIKTFLALINNYAVGEVMIKKIKKIKKIKYWIPKYYKKGDDDKTIRNFKPKQNEVYC